MDCVNREANREDCTCLETSCSRHGICCECIRYHRNLNEYPNCLR
ncbi:MAG: hypothetical protein ABH834_01150 [Candidatus Altiarchaeota archaeon]